MSDCCSAILNLGCIYSCDLIQTGQTAAATGTYILEKQPEGIKIVSNTITAGQPIVFSGGYLNEDSVTIFKVIKPDGSYLETADSEDCFQVDVKPASDPTLADVEVDCPEPTCEDCDPSTVRNSDSTYSTTVACSVTLVLPDETYNIYIDGNLNQTFTHPPLSPVDVNIWL